MALFGFEEQGLKFHVRLCEIHRESFCGSYSFSLVSSCATLYLSNHQHIILVCVCVCDWKAVWCWSCDLPDLVANIFGLVQCMCVCLLLVCMQ